MYVQVKHTLGDKDSRVRDSAIEAGKAIASTHGNEYVSIMLPVCESWLEKHAATDERFDDQRAGVAVFLGALAAHLPRGDARLQSVAGTLRDVLKTPAEDVQKAAADVLPDLIKAMDADEQAALIKAMLSQLVTSEGGFGARKGAAMGLASAVKGIGIVSLKKLGIMDALKAVSPPMGNCYFCTVVG